jgi:hypothetical protein
MNRQVLKMNRQVLKISVRTVKFTCIHCITHHDLSIWSVSQGVQSLFYGSNVRYKTSKYAYIVATHICKKKMLITKLRMCDYTNYSVVDAPISAVLTYRFLWTHIQGKLSQRIYPSRLLTVVHEYLVIQRTTYPSDLLSIVLLSHEPLRYRDTSLFSL